jgi:acyl-CoA reductase-like NAD-dependent aldehyde dehydrogenase
MGNDSSSVRSRIRHLAGLTLAEDGALKVAAKDYYLAVRRYFKQRGQLLATMANGALRSPAVLAQLRTLENQRTSMASSHIAQIKTAFGDLRFQALDAFVRAWYSQSKAPSN